MPRRLDQLLANLGYGSRTEVKRFVAAGRVTFDGKATKDSSARLPEHLIAIDGEPLDFPEGILVMLNKPAGLVCTHAGDEGDTIYQLLPERWLLRNPQVSTIGRLDKDATGLILMTDRTELMHLWTSPRSKVQKVYEVHTDLEIPETLPAIFAGGEILLHGETEPCRPGELEILEPRVARLTITEGRYHQVKRMFAATGLHVESLHRVGFGKLALGDLEIGKWKAVSTEEV